VTIEEKDIEGDKALADMAEEDPDFKQIAELLEESKRAVEDVKVKSERLRKKLDK
jgi:hypothetical protein